MKRTNLILGVVVWSASLTLAFIAGQRGSQPEVNPTAASPLKQSTKRSVDSYTSTSVASTESATDDAASEASEIVAAYFENGQLTLQEALEQVKSLTPTQTRTFIGEAFSLPFSDPNRSRLITALLSQLATTAPIEALELADQIGSLRDTERAKLSILQSWANNDPIAALTWAKTALVGQPGNVAQSQMLAIIRGYAELNPQAAFQETLAMSQSNRNETRLRASLMSEVIETQVRAGDVEQAKLNLALLPDGELKDTMVRELVDEWASFDPAGAAAYVDTLGEAATSRIKSALASEWAENDPAAAAAWLSTLDPSDPTVARAASEVIREWTNYDLNASAEWLNSLPASPELDRAVASYTFRAAQEDPANAMSWAESVTSDRMREHLMGQVAANWKQDDAEGFETYLNTSDFTDEQKEQLLNAESDQGGGRGDRGGPGGGGGGGSRRPR